MISFFKSNYIKIPCIILNEYIQKVFRLVILNLILGVSFFSLEGCRKSWLDKKPDRSLTVPTTLEDFQALLDNSNFMNLKSPALGEIASDGHYVPNTNYNNGYDVNKNGYSWSHLYPYQNVPDWLAIDGTGPYGIIFYCNIVLEGVDKISNKSIAVQNIKGQALFQRSRSFFELSQIYSPPYQSTLSETDLGIPLRLSSDVNIPTVRPNVKTVYDQIIKDLILAKDLLPVTPVYATRASRPAIFALLARVYLSMEEYEKARQFADSCLSIYNTLLDYNNRDSLASFPFTRFNPEVIFHCTLYNDVFIGSSAFVDSNLYKSYSINDLRRVMFFRKNLDGSVSFKGSYHGSRINFSGLATDEMYLVRSECNARLGNVNAAITDLNNLLKKRWRAGTFIDIVASNQDEALSKILEERNKELLFRGIRWSDLRRLNRHPRFKLDITRNINGIKYTIEPNSYKYTFPIPDDIIAITGIEQNYGW